MTADNPQYYTLEEAALLKAKVKLHECIEPSFGMTPSIEAARHKKLEGWEEAAVYLEQFEMAVDEQRIETKIRTVRYDNGLPLETSTIAEQDVMTWPSLNSLYDRFGFAADDDPIAPRSRKAYDYLIQGFIKYLENVENNKPRPRGCKNLKLIRNGKVSLNAVKDLLRALHPKVRESADETMKHALDTP